MNQFCSLDLRKLADKKANYHTHTTRCNHAIGDEREYVEKAIEAGYQILGFSDHSPYLWGTDFVSSIRMKMHELDGYVRTIENLREEYKKDITIYTGLEIEYFPELFENTVEQLKQYPLDYMLLGQHYFDTEIGYKYVARDWEEESYLQTYLRRIEAALDTGYFLYVAHPDIMKYVGKPEVYEKFLAELAKLLKKHNKPIEVNVNGYRKALHYPNPRFVEIGIEIGNDFIIGVDAHAPSELVDYKSFEGCVQMVKERGGRVINL